MTVKLFDGTQHMGTSFTGGVELDVHRCGACGVIFAFDADFGLARQRDHTSWYCPNGHSFHFSGKSDLEKLEDEVARERRRVAATRDLLVAEERSHAATKGHLTRQKKRAAAGACPCCNRTFQQLARHMKTQHPDYVQEAKT